MKFRKIIIDHLTNLPYFGKEMIRKLCLMHNLSLHTVNSYIHKALIEGEILSLRRGLYVTKDFYIKNIPDIGYKYFLANGIRKPSYVSSWAALDYYGMTTDVIKIVVSVSTKPTRTYFNKIAGFKYHAIKKELFHSFELKKSKKGFKFFIASPAKALFDLLYFRTHQFKSPKKDILEELRINVEEMERSELTKFKLLLKENNIRWKIL